jgi:rfaE bifunctional protein kinase chain/domain
MKKIFIAGHFNVLHPGHLRLLKGAKELGGHLIVAVESDEIAGDSAYVSENLRLDAIKNISLVNEAFIMREPLTETLKKIKPNIVVKGKEHEFAVNPESHVVKKYGGKIIFSSGEAMFSSLDLLKKEFDFLIHDFIKLPESYLSRHKIKKTNLVEIVNKFSRLSVCVLGDLIVDEYIICDSLGMSQEDPTIVVTPINNEKFIGGAAIVAAHASNFTSNVHFFSVTGKDESSNFSSKELKKFKVKSRLFKDETRPTTLKQRFRCSGKTMLRVSHLHQNAISLKIQNRIFSEFKKIMPKIDLLVFSDFNYGCLPQTLVNRIISLASKNNIMMIADSQSSSQIGDISRFKNMFVLTPTEREARVSLRNSEDGLIILAEKLRQQTDAKNILLKLGSAGLLIHAANDNGKNFETDQIEALNSAPKDVSGAGDSLLIVTGMALASGANIWEASLLGSLAAAVQVSRLGNVPLEKKELFSFFNK